MLALFLFVLLMWSVAVGDAWLAVPAAFVGSFIVQSHVGFLGVVGVVTVGAVVLLVRRRVREPDRPPLRRPAFVSALVLAACWVPVAYGTLVQPNGNLHHMIEFLSADRPTAGWSKALRVMGLQWGPRPEWIFGSRGADQLGVVNLDPRWWLAVVLLVAAGGFAVAIRHRDRAVTALGVLVALAVLATTLSAASIVGPLFPYLVRWTWVTGAFLGVVTILGFLTVASARVVRLAAVMAVAGLVAVGTLSAVAAACSDVPYADRQAGERALSEQVLAALPSGHGPVLIDSTHGLFAVPGLTLQIERQGIPVMVSPWQSVVYGDRRLPHRSHFRAVLAVAEGAAANVTPLGARRIAAYRERNRAGQTTEQVAVFLMHPQCVAHVDRRDTVRTAGYHGAHDGPVCTFAR
jgi:hypothetical protein